MNFNDFFSIIQTPYAFLMVPFLFIAVHNPHVAASVYPIIRWLADAKFGNYKLLKAGTSFLFIAGLYLIV